VDREAGVLTITLNRPRVHNAYNAAMRDRLVEALRLASADAEIRTVVLRGAGQSFCSGGDLSEFGRVSNSAANHVVRTTRSAAAELVHVGDRVRAELHGHATGAGIELAAFAAHVAATPDTVARLPELGMGLIPGSGGTVSIARRIGRERTAWLALSGARLDARRALAWGLFDEIMA
jgi:enoyl-CoA hydratase/carnithine racemase